MSTEQERAQMITEREAAELLGVAVGTLRRMRYSGIAPPHVVFDTGTIRYWRSDVVEHMRRRQGGRL